MDVKKLVERVGRPAVLFLVFVGAIGSLLRVFNWSDLSRDILMFDPSFADPNLASFEGRYDTHPILTLIHILPGLVVLVLGPLQFTPGIRARYIQVHRWLGRIFVAMAIVAGVSAVLVGFTFPVLSGFSAQVAMTSFAVILLFSVAKAFFHIRRHQTALHREWMIRAFAVALGIATFRVMSAVFMLAGVGFWEAWDTVVWLGFALNLVVAEVWINLTRPTRAYTESV